MNINAQAIIVDGDIGELIQSAEMIGGDLVSGGLTSTQIRNIFGEVRRIELNWPAFRESMDDTERENAKNAHRSAVLLRPKLAYQAKRERGRGIEELQKALDPCLKILQDCRDAKDQHIYFQRFVDFFEAILAYHKAAGGRS